jgi:L-threonylcarbamoyladenylate synthase
MRVLSKEEFDTHKKRMLAEMKKKIFIYPTDTIYGIGGNALDKNIVAKIRAAKQSNIQPFSVIAPSKHWIKEHCVLSDEAQEWLKKLPGPYTLILPLKDQKTIAQNVNTGLSTIGVRIPKHWISKVVEELGVPFVTTSANVTAEEVMTSLDDLDSRIKEHVDYLFYDGPLEGKPSTLVHLESNKVKIKERP